MACNVPDCPGNYKFANIAQSARNRFIDGRPTIDLRRNARTHRANEEITLVAMLDLNDRTVTDLKLDCKYTRNSKSFCRITYQKKSNRIAGVTS